MVRRLDMIQDRINIWLKVNDYAEEDMFLFWLNFLPGIVKKKKKKKKITYNTIGRAVSMCR